MAEAPSQGSLLTDVDRSNEPLMLQQSVEGRLLPRCMGTSGAAWLSVRLARARRPKHGMPVPAPAPMPHQSKASWQMSCDALIDGDL